MIKSGNCTLFFITDTFWPAIGGIENAILSLTANLPDTMRCSILTHSFQSNSVTLFNRYWSFVPQPDKDPNGHSITHLKLSLLKRTSLLPLLLWDLPGIKRLIPVPRLFDILYFFYKCAYYNEVKGHLTKVDLVHSFSTGWLSRLTGEICKKEKIPIVHSPAIHFGKWGDSPAQLKSYMNGNALICFSEMMKQELLSRTGILKEHCYVIPPAVNYYNSECNISVPSATGNQKTNKRLIEEPYILFLGRREHHKGLHRLIDAFRKSNLPVKLAIAGPGKKCNEHDSSIIDFGPVSEETKASLLLHCEVFALPSTDESFGIVYTEAMSYGKPVIAIDIPPVNEIVKNGITGILVPPEDTDALSVALKKLLTDNTLRKSMGEKAREEFQRLYSLSVVIPRIVSVYTHCLYRPILQDLT
jgi:glycosyltransferase involved in cell wall biosynthesis